MIISRKHAMRLISSGMADREYRPLARCTAERKLDALYAVLRRVSRDGSIRFDHYTA